MKSCKTMTLRGSWLQEANKVGDQHRILSYESPDRSKAWKLKDAWIFPAKVATYDVTVERDEFIQGFSLLETDIADITMDQIHSVDDNRNLAWGEHSYKLTTNTASPSNCYLFSGYQGILRNELLHDEDRIITNDLFCRISWFHSHSDDLGDIEWNYYVVLEEVEITPTEGILQQLKGIAQSIDS
tara:strand:+ start:875 stop:1429 length:555 start_codon:yes stop_codon:yes gene_type:complete